MVPADSRRVPRAPRYLGATRRQNGVFVYGAVTLSGRPFHAVPLTPFRPSFCGPATPDSPFESPGLGSSAFARHYLRNHCCFLFLRVLRWFTSPGSLPAPMDSVRNNRCSHRLGSPIRKSPDHRLLAPPRGLSQLATSFFAYLRLGIHTHALSSLTIKFTLDRDFHTRRLLPALLSALLKNL